MARVCRGWGIATRGVDRRSVVGMQTHPVVIVGAGPTGLMLAAELALAGVDVVVLERRVDCTLAGLRAGGLLPRTLELLEQRGVADRFVAAGQLGGALGFAQTMLDIRDLPTRHPHVLALWQTHFEQIMAAWVGELGVEVVRGVELVDFAQGPAGVELVLSEGGPLHASYLVGCDGGRSRVRERAGIAFEGEAATTSWLIAEVELDEPPPFGHRRDALGTHAIGRRSPDEPIRVVLTEPRLVRGPATIDELRAALVGAYGTDFGLRGVGWLSRFSDRMRLASSYRRGRVLLAGDAAHTHPPHGGQGLNTGVQDAVNLGWKLAQVVRGDSPDTLLDSYHAERHGVAAHVLDVVRAQLALILPDVRHEALRELVGALLRHDDARRDIAARMAGLDICYALGDGHPLLGRRMPDVALQRERGRAWLSDLLHAAQPVVLELGGAALELVCAPWADRVQRVAAQPCERAWAIPRLGSVSAPAALLIRPDGHVAWVGQGSTAGLAEALAVWCGPPTSASTARAMT